MGRTHYTPFNLSDLFELLNLALVKHGHDISRLLLRLFFGGGFCCGWWSFLLWLLLLLFLLLFLYIRREKNQAQLTCIKTTTLLIPTSLKSWIWLWLNRAKTLEVARLAFLGSSSLGLSSPPSSAGAFSSAAAAFSFFFLDFFSFLSWQREEGQGQG